MDNPLGKASVKTRVVDNSWTCRLSASAIKNEHQI